MVVVLTPYQGKRYTAEKQLEHTVVKLIGNSAEQQYLVLSVLKGLSIKYLIGMQEI